MFQTCAIAQKDLEQAVSGERTTNATEQRMRPMLMTAPSACIGLLPAAISTGIGSQVQRPLATVVVGGMLIGPLILLIVVPALQTMFLGQGGGPRPEGDNGDPGGVEALSDRTTVE